MALPEDLSIATFEEARDERICNFVTAPISIIMRNVLIWHVLFDGQ